MKIITPKDIPSNAFTMYENKWALLSAGDENKSNCMTISWGGFGHIWHKDVAYVYVRPSRFTYSFMEINDHFVITFLKDGYQDALDYLGSASGRNEDKVSKTNLTPIYIDGYPTFNEAEYVIICKKAYYNDIKLEQFTDEEAKSTYKTDDIHRQYIGVIENVYKIG